MDLRVRDVSYHARDVSYHARDVSLAEHFHTLKF
jgi:hypothetical protein